ncbi:MAG TPA: metabolite traffic protein EboE [Planctomycetota bacterium]|nr:metabolite traffic protein EboE [Planctomycetota bacterium]
MHLPGGQQLGYCTNVHPYADLPGLLSALEAQAAPLRARLVARGLLAERASLGVGLWLPEVVARQVAGDPEPLRARLASLGLHAFTVNAFPYGDFHGGRVKDEVFRPTWAQDARLHYTLLAAEALAALLPGPAHGPQGLTGSVSTHTGGYKPWGAACPAPADVARGLLAAADGLAELELRTGRRIVLALEPEPLSLLESTAETVAFFQRWLWPHGARARRHLGLCYDACHQAVEFEAPRASLAALAAAGIPIAKVQLSSALSVPAPARHAAALARYAEDRWFHQVVARAPDGALQRWPDLPEALDALRGGAGHGERDDWRIHFHVPLFAERLGERGELGTTRGDLAEVLACVASGELTPHLEIETYSYALIPPDERAALGAGTLLECLEREFDWVLAELAAARG